MSQRSTHDRINEALADERRAVDDSLVASGVLPDDPGPRHDPEQRSKIVEFTILVLMLAVFGGAMFLLGRLSAEGVLVHPASGEQPSAHVKDRIA